jgi:hypothetical protein
MWVRFPPGTGRILASRFRFLFSRIVEKRKIWLAEVLELQSASELRSMLGTHWWFHFGAGLCKVIMPTDLYKVGPPTCLVWDTIGTQAYARDSASWPSVDPEDAMRHSQLTLLWDIGTYLFGRTPEALRFAMNRVGSDFRSTGSDIGAPQASQKITDQAEIRNSQGSLF